MTRERWALARDVGTLLVLGVLGYVATWGVALLPWWAS